MLIAAVFYLPRLLEVGAQEEAAPLTSFYPEMLTFPDLEQKSPAAWVVVVASFTDQQLAQALQDELRKAGFAAFAVEATGRYRVQVGPRLDRDQAQADAIAIKQRFRLDVELVSYPN